MSLYIIVCVTKDILESTEVYAQHVYRARIRKQKVQKYAHYALLITTRMCMQLHPENHAQYVPILQHQSRAVILQVNACAKLGTVSPTILKHAHYVHWGFSAVICKAMFVLCVRVGFTPQNMELLTQIPVCRVMKTHMLKKVALHAVNVLQTRIQIIQVRQLKIAHAMLVLQAQMAALVYSVSPGGTRKIKDTFRVSTVQLENTLHTQALRLHLYVNHVCPIHILPREAEISLHVFVTRGTLDSTAEAVQRV